MRLKKSIGRERRRCKGMVVWSGYGLFCLFFNAPGLSWMCSGSNGGDVYFVEVQKMTMKQRVKSAHMVFVTAVQFSPDSRCVAWDGKGKQNKQYNWLTKNNKIIKCM